MGFQSFLNRRKKSKFRRNPSTSETLATTPPEEGEMGPPPPSVIMSDRQRYVGELETVFRRFDVNGDGKITWSELGSIMSSLGQQVTEEELRRMVQEVDSDGDGCISLDEFIELNTKDVDSGVVLEDLRNAFSIFDLDNNGSISCEELHRVLGNLGESTTMDECRRMINGVDCDGNGTIDFEEFKLMMMGSSRPKA